MMDKLPPFDPIVLAVRPAYKTTGRFRPEEDRVLINMAKEGALWKEVEVALGGRSAKSCAGRWRTLADEDDNQIRAAALKTRGNSADGPKLQQHFQGRPAGLGFPPADGIDRLEGKCFLDDPVAEADKGSPESATRYSSRPPSRVVGQRSSLGWVI